MKIKLKMKKPSSVLALFGCLSRHSLKRLGFRVEGFGVLGNPKPKKAGQAALSAVANLSKRKSKIGDLKMASFAASGQNRLWGVGFRGTFF